MNSPTKLIDPTGLLPASSSACRQCGKGDLFKGLDSFEERLKATIQSGINFLTKRDMALLQFHVSNGTALGHYYLNNSQQQTGPPRSPRSGGGGRSSRDRYYRGRGLPWNQAMGPSRIRRSSSLPKRRSREPSGTNRDQRAYHENNPFFAEIRYHWRGHAPTGMTLGQYIMSARFHIQRGSYDFRQLYTPKERGEQRWGYVTRTGPDTFIFTSANRDGSRIFTHMIYSRDNTLVNGRVLQNMGIQVTRYPEGYYGPYLRE